MKVNTAIGQLEYMLSIPGFLSTHYLELDPLWKPLHDHPGFQQLIAPAKQDCRVRLWMPAK